MPRRLSARESGMKAKALRDQALRRPELGYATEPRESAAGATSYPVKKIDTASADAIARFMESKQRGKPDGE